MARSCGIRLGPRRYEVVVLDGSPKKHKIAAFESGELADDEPRAASRTLKDVVKRLGVPRDNVGLVIDSGHAAFRRLSLPFAEKDKIEQVVKYEVESELPQWNVDDVVVDWHTLAADEGSSELLITAVPKDDVRAALDVTSGAGVEPFEVELETSAMVNAAVAAELCNLDDAQLLVHIGDHSTSVVVMDAGEVREMRVIHIGALTHEASPLDAPPVVEAEEAEEAEEGEEDDGALALTPEVDPAEVSRRVDQAIKRIRRELGRTVSGARTINSIEAIYVCGMELPDLIGSAVLDVPVYVLDCFDGDSGQPADGFGQLVVAYGAAVRELGGGLMTPNLRRDDLRFTGTWERVEFPLAVACLLLTTFLGVVWILQKRELSYLDDYGARHWLESSNNFLLGQAKDNNYGLMNPPPDDIVEFAAQFTNPETRDTSLSPIQVMERIKAMVQDKIIETKRQLGQDSAVTQPQSALVGAHLVLQVLEKNAEAWRPTIWGVVAETRSGRSRTDQNERVEVSLDLVFHAESVAEGNRNYEAFLMACRQIPGFLSTDVEDSIPLENSKGVQISGQQISVNVQVFYGMLAEEGDNS